MKKGIIISASKYPKRNVYTFKKKERLIEVLVEIFLNLGFNEADSARDLFVSDEFLNGKTEYKYILINEIRDRVYNLKNEIYDIDLFIGFENVILVIRTKEDRQQEIAEIIFKFAELKEV